MPYQLTDQQKTIIIEELKKRAALRPCARCGQDTFLILDGLFMNLMGDGKNIVFGGPAVPTVGVVCKNCGALTEHAVGLLGLFGELGLMP